MFIYSASDLEIVFRLIFSSHSLYLSRRENYFELYIYIYLFCFTEKDGFVNNLPILVNIAHRNDHWNVRHVPLLDRSVPNT